MKDKNRLMEKLPDGSFIHKLRTKVEAHMSKGMPFFPEYTRHDMTHIDETLDLASSLIPDETLNKLEPDTVEILVAAILIHDLGMFIQQDGLKQLIFDSENNPSATCLDIVKQEKLTWGRAWDTYFREVRRYSQQHIDHEFGLDADDEKIDALQFRKDKIEMKYAKVYGGFLRRYHPRLAYEIAVKGMPGTTVDDIFSSIDEKRRKLIGIAARSHGMNLRNVEHYLKKEFPVESDEPLNIPIYYIMAVLRLADYLHAGKKRAPAEAQRAQEVVTPGSLHEIAWNQAVYDGMHFDFDKRQIYIDTRPENSSVFLALEKWLADVQRELEVCLAVLDEKYRDKYKLSISRVIAEIFNEQAKNNWREEFLPRRAELSVNPEIVKLMIAPLYGNNPSYGVRELLQNAIDACNELEDIERAEGRDYTGKITVEVDTRSKTFTITDNGVGMNEDVLVNYYLTVGASYRRSESWTKKHMDDDGKSRVVRSGRFGVGVMAAFLLGERVTVTTRHYEDDRGYRFSFDTESKALDVVRTGEGEVEVGTVICVDLTDAVVGWFEKRPYVSLMSRRLEWTEWYKMSQPLVTYVFNGIGQPTEKETYIDNDSWNWHSVETTVFDNVKWSLERRPWSCSDNQNWLFCNGVKIKDSFFGFEGIVLNEFGYVYQFKIQPHVSICDKNGRLALSLARDSVENFPESEKLIYDIYSYELATILDEELQPTRLLHASNYVFSEYGFTLNQYAFLLHVKYGAFLVVFRDADVHEFDYSGAFRNIEVLNFDIFFKRHGCTDAHITIGHQSIFTEKDYYSQYGNGMLLNAWHKESPFKSVVSCSPTTFSYLKNHPTRTAHHLGNGIWHFTPEGGGPPLPVPNGLTLDDNMPLVLEYRPVPTLPEDQNIMLKVLRTYLPHQGEDWDGWIPLKLEDRVQRYPDAFVQLFKYISKAKQPQIRELLANMGRTPLEDN
ncbi:MAG: ATP-binding protein [Oscillospiraceae bacterium]|nr:ATP-binding protein [Oscillospiraceae bacterium]